MDKKIQITEQTCGTDAAKYLQNKNRGGKAGSEGVHYENFFAICEAAELIGSSPQDLSLLSLNTQTLDFVDDLMIRQENQNRSIENQRHFQLKNSTAVTWNAGKHPVSDDFRFQKQINDADEIPNTVTVLVVSCPNVEKNLADSIPNDIADHTELRHFAFSPTLNHQLQVEPRLRDALANLCVSPDLDKLERLGSLFLGEWTGSSGGSIRLDELWNKIRRHEPNYLRQPEHIDIRPEFDQILRHIEGFSYTVDSGFFEWQYRATDSGMLDYPVGSEQFDRLQTRVITDEPGTFEELERHLL